nr:sulfite exporter TauE/SafE family protein [Halorussus litoreus]
MLQSGGAFAIAPRVELSVFLLIGLLGGAHCLGMCGPLVSMYADRMDGGTDERAVTLYGVRQQLLFNLGRAATYALIGGAMGALGAAVVDAAAVASAANAVRAVVGVVVGLFVVAVGVQYARGDTTGGVVGRLERGRFGATLGRATAALTGRIDGWVDGPRIALLGAVHGVLPCPLLYPAYLYALARGDPVGGALALGTLGVGTVPALLVYGTLFESMGAATRTRLHRALGVAFVVLGYLPLSHGLVLLGVPVPFPPVHEIIYQPVDAIVSAAEYCLPA